MRADRLVAVLLLLQQRQQVTAAEVAAEFPELCEAETRVFAQLLDSHVQRLATIAHGDGVCTTHVPRPVKPSDHPNRKAAS